MRPARLHNWPWIAGPSLRGEARMWRRATGGTVPAFPRRAGEVRRTGSRRPASSPSERIIMLSLPRRWARGLGNRIVQRAVPCHRATTTREREAIARLRYEVHVREHNVPLGEADH